VESGAIGAASPKEATAKSDVLLTSLRDDRALLDVINGEEGTLSDLQPNRIHVGTSTASPSLSTRLVEMHRTQGCSYQDAHVGISFSQAYCVCGR